MHLHLFSDLHIRDVSHALRTVELPDCDVIIAAGDIGVGVEGAEFLKGLNRPVVYVAGNHELYAHPEQPQCAQSRYQALTQACEGSLFPPESQRCTKWRALHRCNLMGGLRPRP